MFSNMPIMRLTYALLITVAICSPNSYAQLKENISLVVDTPTLDHITVYTGFSEPELRSQVDLGRVPLIRNIKHDADAVIARAEAEQVDLALKRFARMKSFITAHQIDVAQLFVDVIERRALKSGSHPLSWVEHLNLVQTTEPLPERGILATEQEAAGGLKAYVNIAYHFSPYLDFFEVIVEVDVDSDTDERLPADSDYRSKIVYQSNKVAAMNSALRTASKEKKEQKIEKSQVSAFYKDLLKMADKKDRRELKAQRKQALADIRNQSTFVDSDNRYGKLWLDNDGALLKQVLNNAAEEVAMLLLKELNAETKENIAQSNKLRKRMAFSNKNYSRMIISHDNGGLFTPLDKRR